MSYFNSSYTSSQPPWQMKAPFLILAILSYSFLLFMALELCKKRNTLVFFSIMIIVFVFHTFYNAFTACFLPFLLDLFMWLLFFFSLNKLYIGFLHIYLKFMISLFANCSGGHKFLFLVCKKIFWSILCWFAWFFSSSFFHFYSCIKNITFVKHLKRIMCIIISNSCSRSSSGKICGACSWDV